ncbi:MAG: hypothetical protein KDJ16_02045 [Hyphomicrobiales bacterium]|nr:hypothetical protein [Hyphomicrobiales bacterium]
MLNNIVSDIRSYIARPRNLVFLIPAIVLVTVGIYLDRIDGLQLLRDWTNTLDSALRNTNAIAFGTLCLKTFPYQLDYATGIVHGFIEMILWEGVVTELFERGANYIQFAYLFFILPIILSITSVTTVYYAFMQLLAESNILGVVILISSFLILLLFERAATYRQRKQFYKIHGSYKRKGPEATTGFWDAITGFLWTLALVVPLLVALATLISLGLYYLLIALTYLLGATLGGIFHIAAVLTLTFKVFSTSDQLHAYWSQYVAAATVPTIIGAKATTTGAGAADGTPRLDTGEPSTAKSRHRAPTYVDEPNMLVGAFYDLFFYEHGVEAVALSPDGRLLAAIGRLKRDGDRILKLVDAVKRKTIDTVALPETAAIYVSSRQSHPISHGYFGLRRFPIAYASLSFSPDGRYLQVEDTVHDLTAGTSQHAPNWSWHAEALRPVIASLSDQARDDLVEVEREMVGSADQKRVAFRNVDDFTDAERNNRVLVMDGETGDELACIPRNSGSYCFAADGNELVTANGGEDDASGVRSRVVEYWSISSGELIRSDTVPVWWTPYRSIDRYADTYQHDWESGFSKVHSNDGKLFAARDPRNELGFAGIRPGDQDDDGEPSTDEADILVCETVGPHLVSRIDRQFGAYFFSPDDRYLAGMALEKRYREGYGTLIPRTLELWGVRSGVLRRAFRANPRSAAFARSGHRVVTGGNFDGDVLIWDCGPFGVIDSSQRDLGFFAAIGMFFRRIVSVRAPRGEISTVSNDKRLRAVAVDGNRIEIRDADTGATVNTLEPANERPARITALAFGWQNRLLFVGDRSGQIDIRRIADGRSLLRHKIHDRFVKHLYYRPPLEGETEDHGRLQSSDGLYWKNWDTSRLTELEDAVDHPGNAG